MAQVDPKEITSYAERNPDAPNELDAFSFLIGKWQGKGRARLGDGKFAEFDVSWIGRYILDGTAIADELHSLAPDGSPYLGISLRQYDAKRKTWIIEYLNVSSSFLRRQVNADSGSVTIDGPIVTVSCGAARFDEPGKHYSALLIATIGSTASTPPAMEDIIWNEGQVEMAFHRSEM